jgi:hypothetical protein
MHAVGTDGRSLRAHDAPHKPAGWLLGALNAYAGPKSFMQVPILRCHSMLHDGKQPTSSSEHVNPTAAGLT